MSSLLPPDSWLFAGVVLFLMLLHLGEDHFLPIRLVIGINLLLGEAAWQDHVVINCLAYATLGVLHMPFSVI